jgi:hypothetical protein
MTSYRTVYLWENEFQPRTISGWEEILMQWEESITMPAFVQTVIENLKAASNWDSGKDYPLSHFLRFIDYESVAIKWFLYEVVALRWMWGESRIDYLKDLVKMVDIDSNFPIFPGSPNDTTIRKFLNDHLNADEKEYVEMPAAPEYTTHIGNITIRINSDGRRIITTTENPESVQPSGIVTPQDEEPVSKSKKEKKVKQEKKVRPAQLQIRFNRESGDDDIITIVPSDFDAYNIIFRDNSVDVAHKQYDLVEEEVQVYLSEVLRMSCVDRDPYQNIQLNLPGRPQVMIPFNPDSYTRELIYDSVESVMSNWPMVI